MEYRIASVEDDQDIARIIKTTLKAQGYDVTIYPDGASFRAGFLSHRPDMILLDLMLPDCSGLDLLKELRSDPKNDPIQVIIVSAKSQVMDKVDGLDLGADDYLEKPFDILELISRVNAKVRRQKRAGEIQLGEIYINERKHLCKVEGKEVHLTNAEFLILYTIMKNGEAVTSRDELYQTLWGGEGARESRTVDAHINSLRGKLGKHGRNIASVYGIGYRYSQGEDE